MTLVPEEPIGGTDIDVVVQQAIREAVDAAGDGVAEATFLSPIPMASGEAACERAKATFKTPGTKEMDVDRLGVLKPNSSSKNGGSNLDLPGQPIASLRLYKAKIRVLERDLEVACKEVTCRQSELQDLHRIHQDLKADRTVTSKSTRLLENQVLKLQKQVDDLKGQAAARDTIIKQLQDEKSTHERNQQAADADNKAHNGRLNRALEEVQRYRLLLEEAKNHQKNQKSVARSEYRLLAEQKLKLERQRTELLAGFRKQMKLIDVLKRQKVHMETARLLQLSEDDFLKALKQ